MEILVNVSPSRRGVTAFPSRVDNLLTAPFVRTGRRFAFGVCALLVVPVSLLCQQFSSPDELAAQVKALNAELSVPAVLAAPARAAEILTARASLLSQLMAADPAQAAALVLPSDIAERLRASAPPDALETSGEWTGTLTMVVGDDFERHRSSMRWILATPKRIYDVAPPTRPQLLSGRSVRISGITLRGHILAGAIEEAASNGGTTQGCTTVGPQSIAVLMLTTPSYPTFPSAFTQASLQEAFFGSAVDMSSTQSLNGFWKEMSYGLASATGQVFGPFALTQDYTVDTQSQMVTEAVNVADSTVDFSQFTRIALVFPIQNWGVDDESTVGCATISSPSKGSLPASISWLPAPIYGTPPIATYAHELGHALGLNHSSSDDYGPVTLGAIDTPGLTGEYGDPFSVMGYPYPVGITDPYGVAPTGANACRDPGEIGGIPYFGPLACSGQYVAEHKSLILQWLHPGDYLEVSAPGTYMLAPYETSGLRALRILRDAGTSAWLWVEYRQAIGDIDGSFQNYSVPTNVFSGA